MKDVIEQAEQLFSEGRLEEARQLLEPLAEGESASAEILNALGAIAFAEGHDAEALGLVSAALQKSPSDRDSLFNYLSILEALGRKAEAHPAFQAYCEAHPEDKEIAETFASIPKPPEIVLPNWPVFDPGPGDPLNGAHVLHAPFEIAGCIERFTRHLRSRGVAATGANYYDSWMQFKCDINLNLNSRPVHEHQPLVDSFYRHAIYTYDIFHFHFAHSFFPGLDDLENLREANKKILFNFWGSDSRSNEVIWYHQAKFMGYQPPEPYFNSFEQYEKLKKIDKYADVLLGLNYIPRYTFFPGFADTNQWRLEDKQAILKKQIIQKKEERLTVLHAPSANWKKGTRMILEVLQDLKDKGLPIDILYVSGKTLAEAREFYAYADVAVDQVGIGTFGLFGIEMMAWEIPVIVYGTDFYDSARDFPPSLRINNKEELANTIARAVEMKANGELAETGRRSRKWVLDHVDVHETIDGYISIYQKLLNSEKIEQEINPDWYEQEKRIIAGEKNEFYRYMNDSGAFNSLSIAINQYDKRLYY